MSLLRLKLTLARWMGSLNYRLNLVLHSLHMHIINSKAKRIINKKYKYRNIGGSIKIGIYRNNVVLLRFVLQL